jgi:hypothetical protein
LVNAVFTIAAILLPPNACISADCGWARFVPTQPNLAGKLYFKKRAVAIRLEMLVGRALADP